MKKIVVLIYLLTPLITYGHDANYIFAWSHLDDSIMNKPRGGTTAGPKVSLEESSSIYWRKLQNRELNKFDKDRLAILAMQGGYRVHFDFMETMGFFEGYSPAQPYQSWATEFILVVDEEKHFISLQHILVVYLEQEDGSLSEAHVMKHWRQDWKYEDSEMHVFLGDNTWTKQRVPINQRKGSWSQSVYHVDDSPRYQGYGRWVHHENFSSWTSNETRRPMPRRETDVREDYDILSGINIQTITPDGWVHEQNNKKVALGTNPIVLAKEIGLARYQRIANFDWAPGMKFWQSTDAFWKEVREEWARKMNTSKNFKLITDVDGHNIFMRLFQLSYNYEQGNYDAIESISAIIGAHSVAPVVLPYQGRAKGIKSP